MKVDSPNLLYFGAKTSVFDADNVLTNAQVQKIVRAGKKIGTDADTINFYIGEVSKKKLMFSHNADFKSSSAVTNSSGFSFYDTDKVDPFEYFMKKLQAIKSLYKKIK